MSSGTGGVPRRAHRSRSAPRARDICTPSSPRKDLAQRPRRHARGRLPRARPLEDVADVVEAVLQRADEIRVARTGTRQLVGLRRPRPRVPSASAYFVSNSRFGIVIATGAPIVRPWRTPARNSNASASNRCRPPRPWPCRRRARSRSTSSRDDRHPGRQPLDDRRQAATVRLTGGEDADHGAHHRERSLAARTGGVMRGRPHAGPPSLSGDRSPRGRPAGPRPRVATSRA